MANSHGELVGGKDQRNGTTRNSRHHERLPASNGGTREDYTCPHTQPLHPKPTTLTESQCLRSRSLEPVGENLVGSLILRLHKAHPIKVRSWEYVVLALVSQVLYNAIRPANQYDNCGPHIPLWILSGFGKKRNKIETSLLTTTPGRHLVKISVHSPDRRISDIKNRTSHAGNTTDSPAIRAPKLEGFLGGRAEACLRQAPLLQRPRVALPYAVGRVRHSGPESREQARGIQRRCTRQPADNHWVFLTQCLVISCVRAS